MNVRNICGAAVLMLWCGCAALLPPEEVLRNSAVAFERKSSVSIPVLKVNLEIAGKEKTQKIFLTGKVTASQPDRLRMKLTKANYHLASMVVNGHNASIFFPRTNKILNRELNKPLLSEEDEVDILSSAIELCMIFLKGPFPGYPVTGYTFTGTKDGCHVYETEIQGGKLILYIDGETSLVQKRVYSIRGKEAWTVELYTSMYKSAGMSRFPRKFRLVLDGPEGKPDVAVEMYISRISFNRNIPDKAFKAAWPEQAQVIQDLPSNPEELFGKLEEEKEQEKEPE